MRKVLTVKPSLWLLVVLWLVAGLHPAELRVYRDAGHDTRTLQGDWRRHYGAMFGAGFQQRITEVSAQWKLSLTTWRTCPQAVSNHCFLFRVDQSAGAASSEFRLANETAQVDAITIISPSRAAILGRAMHNMYVVTPILLPSGLQLDRIICYWPALSPKRRFVAYLKFFPAHPGYEYSPSAEYLIYDLTAQAEDNRTPPNRARPLQPYDAGWPLYPGGLKNTPGDNMFEGHDVPVHWMTSEGFFWLDESDTLAFADRWQGVCRLVVADVSNGIQQPKVSAYPIDIARVVDLPGCKSKVAPSDFEGWSKDSTSLISVTNILGSPEKSHSLRVSFSPHPCLATTTLNVRLSR
jgi:hypothetical protein